MPVDGANEGGVCESLDMVRQRERRLTLDEEAGRFRRGRQKRSGLMEGNIILLNWRVGWVNRNTKECAEREI